MMTQRELRRADLLTAPLMALLGSWTVIEGLRMPMSGTYAGRPIHWYTSPGFFPILIGALIGVCSIGVFWRALAADAHRGLGRRVTLASRRLIRSRAAGRTLLIWSLLGGYIAAIAGNPFGPLSNLIENKVWTHTVWTRFLTDPDGTNYLLCSFLFLTAFMLLFHRPRFGRLTARAAIVVILFCAIISWSVSYVFSEVLYTPLP